MLQGLPWGREDTRTHVEFAWAIQVSLSATIKGFYKCHRGSAVQYRRPKEFEEPVPIVSSPSGSSAELDDSATVAFGGTAFWQLFKLPHRPTLCRRLGA